MSGRLGALVRFDSVDPDRDGRDLWLRQKGGLMSYCPQLTAPDEFGLVYDSTHLQPTELQRDYRGLDGMHRYNPTGCAIFATIEDRRAAMEEMVQLGFVYMVTYNDVHGAGLSWCFKPHWPEYSIRPSARRGARASEAA